MWADFWPVWTSLALARLSVTIEADNGAQWVNWPARTQVYVRETTTHSRQKLSLRLAQHLELLTPKSFALSQSAHDRLEGDWRLEHPALHFSP